MKEELHLFIIWENARNKQEEIIKDIKENFEIINIYDICWSKDKFSNNLSRFYGTNLPKGSGKEQHCGNGNFLLIIIKDLKPEYTERMTSKGSKIVNINMFDKKEKYRQWTGGGHRIHATNDEIETNHDITLLLGKNVKDYLKENNTEWDGKVINIANDLLGSNGWKTVNEMFYALNNCTNYAILRNYESLPDEIYENEHNDIDLICESMEDTAYILNAKPVFKENEYVAGAVFLQPQYRIYLSGASGFRAPDPHQRRAGAFRLEPGVPSLRYAQIPGGGGHPVRHVLQLQVRRRRRGYRARGHPGGDRHVRG